MVFVYNGWISGLHPRQFFVTDEDTVMHDDQSDATKWMLELMEDLEMYTWPGLKVIDSTAFVLDDTQRMLPSPVHNSTTERCRIMDNDEPL